MSDTYKRREEAQGSSGSKGALAGKTFDTDEQVRRKKWDEDYHKSQGATGLGGAVKRSKPEYKKAHEEAWKKASATGWGNTK